MTTRDRYNLTFNKTFTPGGRIDYFVTQNGGGNIGLAYHIASSNLTMTNAQINSIVIEQDSGTNSDFFWGEVDGSSLYFHTNNTVEIGDGGTIIPTEDFKELLQEWLAFISA